MFHEAIQKTKVARIYEPRCICVLSHVNIYLRQKYMRQTSFHNHNNYPQGVHQISVILTTDQRPTSVPGRALLEELQNDHISITMPDRFMVTMDHP